MKDYQAITLTAGACELELIPEFGGLSNMLRLGTSEKKPVSIISGLANRQEMETDGGYRGIPLFPIVNRLDKGQYQYNGQNYQLEQNEVELQNTLHGFLQHIQPTCTIHEQSPQQAVACLHYAYKGENPGYPFPADIKITFYLKSEGSLKIQFKIENKHTSPIPVGVGWHPYFKLGDTVNNLSLQLPPVKHTEVNERMLPTGIKTDFKQFEKLALIGDQSFDDCFEVQDQSRPAKITLWSEQNQQGFELWQQTGSDGFNFIQVCIPANRESIAIEPVSCGINAFNTHDGLIHLKPNSAFSVECGVKCI